MEVKVVLCTNWFKRTSLVCLKRPRPLIEGLIQSQTQMRISCCLVGSKLLDKGFWVKALMSFVK